MALVSYRKFRGEMPIVDPALLPQGSAQYAESCDFVQGTLKSMRDGSLIATMQSNPIKGIYSEDGINFFTWNTDTLAYRTPIIEDAYNRVYFLRLIDGLFKVTTKLAMAPSGPTPLDGNSYRTGVPRPTVAPVLELVERTTLPDYPTMTISFDAWYEYNGTVYDQVTGAAFTTTNPYRAYSITKPTRGSGTPALATPVVRMRGNDGTSNIIDVTMRSVDTVRSQAFPGTQEYTLIDTTTLVVNIKWGPEETRAYVYTNQNTWDEESGPSPAAKISPTYMQDVRVTVAASVFTGYRPFLKNNLYRTFGSNASYIGAGYTGSFPTYIDFSRNAAYVLSSLESVDWDPAPTGLQGLCDITGGLFAVFKDNAVYISEPYRPHAFPYIFSFPSNVRGICATQQALVVTTADGLYLISGANPASAQPVKLSTPQPGIAQRSMVNIDGGVCYASRDGFVLVDGSAASMLSSQQLFGMEKWRELYGTLLLDASLRFSYQDGFLVATSHTEAKGFVLRFAEDSGALTQSPKRIDATFQLPIADSLYYSIGANLYRYQGGSELPFTWHGRDESFPMDEIFGAGFLRGSGPITLTLYADGVQAYSATVNPGFFRLPSTFPRCLRLSVRVQGTGTINELTLGQTMAELQNG